MEDSDVVEVDDQMAAGVIALREACGGKRSCELHSEDFPTALEPKWGTKMGDRSNVRGPNAQIFSTFSVFALSSSYLTCPLSCYSTKLLSACSRISDGSQDEADRTPADRYQNRGLESRENLPPASRDSPITRSADHCGTRPDEQTAPDAASPVCSGRQCSHDRCRRGRLSSSTFHTAQVSVTFTR